MDLLRTVDHSFRAIVAGVGVNLRRCTVLDVEALAEVIEINCGLWHDGRRELICLANRHDPAGLEARRLEVHIFRRQARVVAQVVTRSDQAIVLVLLDVEHVRLASLPLPLIHAAR